MALASLSASGLCLHKASPRPALGSTAGFFGQRRALLPARNVVLSRPVAVTIAAQRSSGAVSTSGSSHKQAAARESWSSEHEKADALRDRPLVRLAQNLLKGVALGAVALALAFGSVGPAEAARSGGRVGGSSFGAARSGGYSSGRSYSGGGAMSSGRSYGSAVAPPIVGGGVGFSSFFFPGYGMGYGYGYGYPAPVVGVGGGGSGLFNLVFFGIAAFMVLQVVQNVMGSKSGGLSLGGERVAVAKVQVGLLSNARQLKADLDRIARRADTNTSEGLHYILQETVLSLLRNPEYCVYGAATTKSAGNLDDGEAAFNQLSLEERGKFEEETLVNVGGRSRTGSYSRGSSRPDELIVVTLLVAVEGGLKLPKISSREELKTALNRLGALRSDQVMAMEVLWTPQDERDTYTREDLMHDYPTLNTL